MSSPFWIEHPAILIEKERLFKVWPQPSMDFNEKLNSITRMILILSIAGYFITRSFRILLTGAITLGVIIFLHHSKTKTSGKQVLKNIIKEGFANPSTYLDIKKAYRPSSSTNPLGNVTLPEIQLDADRKAAPPAFNPKVEADINDNTKKMVQQISFPDDPSVADKLFRDLGDDFVFEHSMRNFYTTANTKVEPGDQKAFAEYLYGDMISCKDGDTTACERNTQSYLPGY